MASNTLILGLQWGDEGKGKIVDALSQEVHAVCRFQGGHNAGHTIKVNGKQTVLHEVLRRVYLLNLSVQESYRIVNNHCSSKVRTENK